MTLVKALLWSQKLLVPLPTRDLPHQQRKMVEPRKENQERAATTPSTEALLPRLATAVLSAGALGLLFLRNANTDIKLRHGDYHRKLDAKSVLPPNIPHKIWFVDNRDIFETKSPKAYYNNVANAVRFYRDAWNEPVAPASFVNDDMCLMYIEDILPELAPFYEEEERDMHKEDMCKLAVLYKHGGYYFSVELEPLNVYTPVATKTMVGAFACEGACIFGGFLGSMPENELLLKALKRILEVYENRKDKALLGSYAMADAYFGLPKEERGQVGLLEEKRLSDEEGHPFQQRQNGKGLCDFVLQDPSSQKVFFFARFLGSNSCSTIKNRDEKPKIPEVLWFTHEHNILREMEPRDAYDNVQRVIDAYRDAWDDPRAVVNFLDDEQCEKKLRVAEPRLVPYFKEETVGTTKGDICSIAATYVHGGYYVDIDMQVVEPFIPEKTTSFVSSLACNGGCFFKSFFASTPGHPILKAALRNMLKTYESYEDTTMLGAITMGNAYFELPEEDKKDVELLEYVRLDSGHDPQLYPYVSRQQGSGNCNYVVHHPKKEEIYFFARFVGYGGCKPRGEDPELDEKQDEAEAAIDYQQVAAQVAAIANHASDVAQSNLDRPLEQIPISPFNNDEAEPEELNEPIVEEPEIEQEAEAEPEPAQEESDTNVEVNEPPQEEKPKPPKGKPGPARKKPEPVKKKRQPPPPITNEMMEGEMDADLLWGDGEDTFAPAH